MLKQSSALAAEERHVFFYLLGYRWLSLLPPFLALAFASDQGTNLQPIFAAALADNLFLTILYPQVNRWVLRVPAILGIDVLIVALFLANTGGPTSLFYLYALSPLLAAAFFFRMRGAIVAASDFAVIYAVALVWSNTSVNLLQALTQITSFFLIAILFGYSAILIARTASDRALLKHSNATLERTNRELTSIHNLALQMQSSAVDVADIQEVILSTITNSMGFERAMLALVDPDRNTLIGWLTRRQSEEAPASSGLFHTAEIPLDADSGVVAQTVLNREPAYIVDGLPPTRDPQMNRRLNLQKYAILPLHMRDHPVGVLLVDNPNSGIPITPESLHSLKLVADQAAIALGSTKLCIERAQKLAIEEERNRIAMEIHDTATQSLFGIVYSLDGIIKRLDSNPDAQAKLTDLRAVASRTMNDLRHSVYDLRAGVLTEAGFKAELEAYLEKLSAPVTLAVEINILGSFNGVERTARRNLLRITAEGLANIVKHSNATMAIVTLDLVRHPAQLIIHDNGRGFDVTNPRPNSWGIGLKSMRERAYAIGAEFRIESQVGHGTCVQVEFVNHAPLLIEPEADSNPARG